MLGIKGLKELEASTETNAWSHESIKTEILSIDSNDANDNNVNSNEPQNIDEKVA